MHQLEPALRIHSLVSGARINLEATDGWLGGGIGILPGIGFGKSPIAARAAAQARHSGCALGVPAAAAVSFDTQPGRPGLMKSMWGGPSHARNSRRTLAKLF